MQLQISDKIAEIEVVQLSQLVHPYLQAGTISIIVRFKTHQSIKTVLVTRHNESDA